MKRQKRPDFHSDQVQSRQQRVRRTIRVIALILFVTVLMLVLKYWVVSQYLLRN